MLKNKIMIIDDDRGVLDVITEVMRNKFGKNYKIVPNESGEEFLDEMNQTDKDGDNISLVLTDEKLKQKEGQLDGHQLVPLIKERNGKTPVIVVTGYSDLEATIKALNAGVNHYVQKPLHYEYLLDLSEKLINEYERTRPKILRLNENTVLKIAETKFEMSLWGNLRYSVYVEQDKIIKPEKLKQELHDKKEEWDDYDRLPSTKQIVILKYEEKDGIIVPRSIGGSRQMVGVVAMEKLHYLGDYRKQGIVPREVSRFIMDKSERGSRTSLLELIRYLFDCLREYPVAFCTSRDHQIPLYEKIGFLPIGPGIQTDQYGLEGKWTPMMFDPHAIWQSALQKNLKNDFPKLNELMYNGIISTILSPDDKMRLGSLVHSEFENTHYFGQIDKFGGQK